MENNNYCRNAGNQTTIWCYTIDQAKRWEYCDPIDAFKIYTFNNCDPWNSISHAKSQRFNNYWKIFTTYDEIYSNYNQNDDNKIDFLKLVNHPSHTQKL